MIRWLIQAKENEDELDTDICSATSHNQTNVKSCLLSSSSRNCYFSYLIRWLTPPNGTYRLNVNARYIRAYELLDNTH